MKCNKKNCPLVGNNENCDIRDCKWRTEDASDNELIRRSDAIKAMEKLIEAEGTMDYAEWDFPTSYKQERINQTEACIDQIRYIPAVEPIKGEWIRTELDIGMNYPEIVWKCSECGDYIHIRRNFCGNCGAKMKGEDDEQV